MDAVCEFDRVHKFLVLISLFQSLIDSQDHDVKKQSIAIARCYPMKNRDPDIMPCEYPFQLHIFFCLVSINVVQDVTLFIAFDEIA